VQFIQSPHTTVTLAKLQFEIADSSQRKALKTTKNDIKQFPKLVDDTNDEILETMESIRITYHNLKLHKGLK